MTTRNYDVVLVGATGFTGSLTAAHLLRAAPDPSRVALAGRSRGKLEAVRAGLGVDVALVEVDATDAASVRRLAGSARVVATTVGPYVRYGDPLVAACAAAGTDYADLTGEPEFVDRSYLRHHATAQRTGARLVHACGFDSIPHDLGAQFTVEQLPGGVPLDVRGYVSASGIPSGGTFESAVLVMSRLPLTARAAAERRRAEARPSGRRVRGVPGTPGFSREVGSWVLPLPTLDPQIVVRSAAALDRYGPDFTYRHYAAVGNPVVAAGLSAGVAGTFVLAQTPPTRALLRRLRPAGAGPSEEARRNSWFRVRFVGVGGDRRVVTEVRGGDPGYDATSVMLAESALCLAYDDLPETAGQVTTAVAMGTTLRERLDRSGITFRVLESS
jgi:saccharopine dehydrogenase (NAD+, L-glutamate forming)